MGFREGRKVWEEIKVADWVWEGLNTLLFKWFHIMNRVKWFEIGFLLNKQEYWLLYSYYKPVFYKCLMRRKFTKLVQQWYSSYSVKPWSPRELMFIWSLSTYSETTTYEMMENHQQTKSQETIGEGNH